MRVKKYFVLKNIRKDAGFRELREEIFSAIKKKNDRKLLAQLSEFFPFTAG